MKDTLGYDGALTCALEVADIDKAMTWYQEVLGFELIYHVKEMGWGELSTPVERVNVGLSQVEKPHPRGGAGPASEQQWRPDSEPGSWRPGDRTLADIPGRRRSSCWAPEGPAPPPPSRRHSDPRSVSAPQVSLCEGPSLRRLSRSYLRLESALGRGPPNLNGAT